MLTARVGWHVEQAVQCVREDVSADWLNYHHLLYFWTVAREGSITAACSKLHLAQPTVSGQLKKLEQKIGGKLYQKVGRELVLTELGKTVFRYADEIFSIGQELSEALRGRPSGRPMRFHVGIPEVLPKLVAFRLLKPALEMSQPVQLICREGPQDQLLTMLAAHEVDVVFSDTQPGSFVRVRAFSHSLGQCGVGVFGTRELVARYEADGVPDLNGAPFLLPAVGTALRRSVDQWLVQTDSTVHIIGEFDDTALMKVFAESGIGFVPAPLAIEKEIREQFALHRLCEIPGASEQFFAITVERKLRHPAVVAISEAARDDLFRSPD